MIKSQILTVIIPIFNDWESFILLLQRIDTEMANKNLQVQVLAVNDGSTTDFNMNKDWRNINRFKNLI